MRTKLTVNDINLLKAQNEGLIQQNRELQIELSRLNKLYQEEHCENLRYKEIIKNMEA
jgi:regulator of replication initiation timing